MIPYEELDSIQQNAIDQVCDFDPSNWVICLSGGAGTGKTTLAQHIFHRKIESGNRPALTATTGKAARRLREATGIAATTVHALLEFPKPGELDKDGRPILQGAPARNAKNPLYHDVVIVDEASMMSHELLGYLFDAMPKGSYVCLIGDHNQLPPIENNGEDKKDGYKSAFCTWKEKNGIVLDSVYRQHKDSGILENAQRLLKGHIPLQRNDFKMRAAFDPMLAIADIARTDKAFSTINAQIITPQNKGKFGAYRINHALKQIYNPNPDKQAYLERYENSPDAITGLLVGTGDKVIVTKNWYSIEPDGVMNGELGVIIDIQEDGGLVIDFGYATITIPMVLVGVSRSGKELILNPQRDIDLAYAITTHKSQGSEWDEVIYAIDKAQGYMLCRANSYTGVTRAKKRVTFVHQTAALRGAIALEPLWKKKTVKG